MENKVHSVCAECGKEFDYILRPGYPRKYCPVCSAKKKQEYEDMQKPEVVRPGEAKKEAPVVPNGQLAMYVSYAKDIFCALIDKEPDKMDSVTVMEIATDLVKQAQKELS